MNKESSQSEEAPKENYIRMRLSRDQATNSHSLAERVRREKISKRMRLLQELVPGCNKITGKAVMLDEINNYVQSLQQEVEFLSMKLATVNPELNVDMDIFSLKNFCNHEIETLLRWMKATILIMNQHKIIKETHSIDDMIQIFNDKVLVLHVRRCIRTSMKLCRIYMHKSQVIKTKSQNHNKAKIRHQTHMESQRKEEVQSHGENQTKHPHAKPEINMLVAFLIFSLSLKNYQ